MFWGATVGSQLDWDGFQLFFDRSLPRPAPEKEAELAHADMPEEEKGWLAAVSAMQASSIWQQAQRTAGVYEGWLRDVRPSAERPVLHAICKAV